MPYLSQDKREDLDIIIDNIISGMIIDSSLADEILPNGNINYIISMLCYHRSLTEEIIQLLIKQALINIGSMSYNKLKEICGELVCASQELIRRSHEWDLNSNKADEYFDIITQAQFKFYDTVVAKYEDICIYKNGDIK